ncbi:MAG: plasmid pRiA4b ORF-3 family protein [Acidobacteria bacterium]|nr:plasmid pRiA4b ORF-3 family protein [Acidobacteriota bacterium]
MSDKKRKRDVGSLPQVKGEMWEIGRRPLDISIVELERKGERPELLLAVQPDERGGVVLADIVSSRTPPEALSDFALRAMSEPLIGKPRRPDAVHVGSQAEADILSETLARVGVELKVVSKLTALDFVSEHAGRELGSGTTGDYRTHAARAGQSLSEDGLRELFRTAKEFYEKELWFDFGEEEIFEIQLHYDGGPSKMFYGVLMGNMGQTEGLALYPSIEAIERLYEFSQQNLGQMEGGFEPFDVKSADREEMEKHAAVMHELLSIPSISLTYASQKETSPPLLQEVKQLKLPLANKSAFPLIMKTGQGYLELAQPDDLRDMLLAMRAILDWDDQITQLDVDDEVGVTIPMSIAPVTGFLPAVSAHTTLRENPVEPPEPEDLNLPEFNEFLDSLFGAQPPAKAKKLPASKKKKVAQKKTGKRTPAPKSNRVYTLHVYLVGGPIGEEYAGKEVSRKIEILGHQTLHDLHEAIFDAFDREEEHLYEFNLGKNPRDRSQRYFFRGGWDTGDEDTKDPQAATIDSLNLKVGHRFGYVFDMGDYWEHVIEVVAVEEREAKGTYPRVSERVGNSPPQYPDEDKEE